MNHRSIDHYCYCLGLIKDHVLTLVPVAWMSSVSKAVPDPTCALSLQGWHCRHCWKVISWCIVDMSTDSEHLKMKSHLRKVAVSEVQKGIVWGYAFVVMQNTNRKECLPKQAWSISWSILFCPPGILFLAPSWYFGGVALPPEAGSVGIGGG